ncbi:SURF1 family protein [Chachezhania antarctica]|uniref:SURF1 family protein n=1 Tax=Chachezhania antarctica TaxID=2340860 RepID=UPI000EB031AA|nr:SURF1 family protein [Chachezhania antarctica]|tara:strand:- start:650 stop:1324 length:675 start_codon:yes stop_codon:yes gene_type:complete
MQRLIFILLFGVLGTSILLGLGIWQVQRLHWKDGMIAAIESRIGAAPVPVPETPDPEDDRYLPVTAQGEILGGEIHVFIPVEGGAAYRVIAPFQMEDGRTVLLDRGSVPVSAKTAERPVGPMTVTGNLNWPNEADGYTPDPDLAGNIWYARDVPAMAQALGTEPVLIVASSPTAPGITPDPVDTGGIPNDHLEYAITWFSLAFIWVAMTGFFLWQTRARKAFKG